MNAVWLFRLLVRMHPPAFRRRYGDAMLEFCSERLAGAHERNEPLARARLRTGSNLIVSLIAEWLRAMIPGTHTSPDMTIHHLPPTMREHLTSLINEFAFAARSLRKSVAFSAAAIATLALGVGSTTAIFSVVNSVLLRPLPYPHAERVVIPQSMEIGKSNRSTVTYADFMDWRDNKVFDKVAVYQQVSMDLAGDGETMRTRAATVGPEFFGAIGVTPAKGRPLDPRDYPLTAGRAVVISDRLWRTRFGSRPDIVGTEIELNAIKRPIVGVLPPDGGWPLTTDVWVPLRLATETHPDVTRRDNYVYEAVARIQESSTFDQTEAAMARLASLAEAANRSVRPNVTMVPTPILQAALGQSTPRALWVLLGAVALLLLIGCVNVANLQLARATARAREMAVRAALGASRARLIRQTFVESLTLSVIGGALGALMARWMVQAIVAVAPTDVPRIETSAVSPAALAFALAVSVIVAMLFGLAPAMQAARSAPARVIGESGARTSGGRTSTRTRRVLVALELALSVVLLTGAGLAVQSINSLRHANVGFDAHPIVTASISLPGARYNSRAKVIAFMNEFRDRLAAAAGVEGAGITTASPLGAGGFYLGRRMIEEGKGAGPDGEIEVQWAAITPGYFKALGVPIREGRDFTVHDDTSGAQVMIVNEAYARAMFPGQNAIGKRAMSSRDEKVYREIVGIVGDVKYFGARDSTRNISWVPYGQNAWGQGIVTVRASSSAAVATQALRRELAAVDNGIALAEVSTMDEAMSRSIAGDRLVAILLGVFAALALILAAVGILGVLSYIVEQRTRELGIRLALGAQRRDMMGLVARETMPMITAGVVVGIGVSLALGRVLQSLFYEIKPSDPVTLVSVSVVLAVIGILAALAPARRAMRIDPVTALRGE